jgi:uncharacterized protein YbjT (DUF2867 family)
MVEVINDRFCFDLPTSPIEGLKVLVTGATGYIGSELIPELLARGYKVRATVRNLSSEYNLMWPGVEIIKADALNYAEMEKALNGIDCAYYLIHSLHLGKNKFVTIDNEAAKRFQLAADKNNLKRIIYLGGLGDPQDELSAHLRSRYMVGEILQQGITPVTFLRAGIVVGSGSSSYKIINRLIKNCPLFIFPVKANSRCQPVAVRDVIKYLVGSLENEETAGGTYDIGGPDIYNYLDMLKIQAEVLDKRRIFILTRFSILPFYARIGRLFVPVPYLLIKSLMESCTNDVVCNENKITDIIPMQRLDFREALTRALTRKSQRKLFIEKQKTGIQITDVNLKEKILRPPARSKSIFSDVYHFLFKKAPISTYINFDSESERQNYIYRILQRLDTEVNNYAILNIHKIGVNAPVNYVFEELLSWNGDSACWPNHIGRVDRVNQTLENLNIYLFGWKMLPKWIQSVFSSKNLKPLFSLEAIKIKSRPDSFTTDNERYLLYRCYGGYPIGIFSMYVRSSIEEENDKEPTQLFLIVGFNFYGKEKLSSRKIINKTWESIHNRVTANVLNRIKQLSEWRFEKIKSS